MKNPPSQVNRLQLSLAKLDPDSLARSCGWAARRAGKLSALAFCSAVIAASAAPACSLRILAALSGIAARSCLSKQALHRRVNAAGAKLIEALLAAAISSRLDPACSRAAIALGFRRIILQDSTTITLPPRLAGAFAGTGNATARGAGMKVHASYDLLAGRFTGFRCRESRSADQAFAREGARGLGAGDLLIRDLGYFCVAAMRELAERGGHALTRLRPKLSLADPASGGSLRLASLLRGRRELDIDVLAGGSERLPMRLIAFKLPRSVAEQRRRRINSTAKRKGTTPSKELLALQDWQLYLTTCPREQLGCRDAMALYQQRWTIEILFKGFKSHMHIDRIPAMASEAMVRCLVLGSLARVALTLHLAAPALAASVGQDRISALKLLSLAAAIGFHPAGMLEALGFLPTGLHFDSEVIAENLRRHCLYEKRKRMTLPQRLCGLG